MIKKIFVLLLLGLSIALAWSLFRTYTEIKAPSLSVGDQWTYLSVGEGGKSYSTEIVDRTEDFEGTLCYVRIQDYPAPTFDAQTVWMTSDWRVLRTYTEETIPDNRYFTTYSSGLKLYDFPLTVGKEWGARSHFSVSNVDAEGEITYTGYDAIDWVRKVVSKETITVPAGTFDTYVIEEIKHGSGTRFWFSLDAKNYVKMEFFGENIVGEGEEVLTNYELSSQENEQGSLLLLITLSAAIGVVGISSLVYNHRKRATRDL